MYCTKFIFLHWDKYLQYMESNIHEKINQFCICGGFFCNRLNSSTRQDMSSCYLHQPAWAQWTCIGFWRSWKLCYGLCSAKKLTRFSIRNPHYCGRLRDFYLQFICMDHLRSAGLSLSSNGTLFINWFCSGQLFVWRMKLSLTSRDCLWSAYVAFRL